MPGLVCLTSGEVNQLTFKLLRAAHVPTPNVQSEQRQDAAHNRRCFFSSRLISQQNRRVDRHMRSEEIAREPSRRRTYKQARSGSGRLVALQRRNQGTWGFGSLFAQILKAAPRQPFYAATFVTALASNSQVRALA